MGCVYSVLEMNSLTQHKEREGKAKQVVTPLFVQNKKKKKLRECCPLFDLTHDERYATSSGFVV
jgi:hypothetical protein